MLDSYTLRYIWYRKDTQAMGLFSKVFGTRSQREVKALTATVDKIEALEDEYRALSDHDLRAKTDEFKSRLAGGETLEIGRAHV